VVASVADVDPGLLVMPAQRVAVPDVPIPYAHDLEYAVLPRQDRIEKAIHAVTTR
jgi:pyruvate dehydrogenase E1 component beta subunit